MWPLLGMQERPKGGCYFVVLLSQPTADMYPCQAALQVTPCLLLVLQPARLLVYSYMAKLAMVT